MSEENVEIVRRFYPGSVDMVATIADPETFEAVRVAWEPLVDRDFETVVAGQVPLAGSAEIPGDLRARSPTAWTDSRAPSVTGLAPGSVGW